MKRKSPLKGKNIILGITGSVAAYKAVELIRRLRDEEAEVMPVMTPASLHFITPLSIELAAGRKPLLNLFDEPLAHVNLPAGAELFIVAPATANIIGKMASAVADCPLTTCWLAFRGGTIVAPAMNAAMYEHPAFRKNLDFLKDFLGVVEVLPEWGMLACGTQGVGRMASIEAILEAARGALTAKDLRGERMLITAGPTREAMDPVRFISNRSSGKMGFALARIALRRGAEVVLISGPTPLKAPDGVSHYIQVETTEQMRQAVFEHVPNATTLIMAAAPSDYAPNETFSRKISKSGSYLLKLKATHDILSGIARLKTARPFLVGFSAETGPMLSRARGKLVKKGLDMIVFNDVSEQGAGFDHDTNKVSIIARGLPTEELPLMDKQDVGEAVLNKILFLKTKT